VGNITIQRRIILKYPSNEERKKQDTEIPLLNYIPQAEYICTFLPT
jgi:hypothetical protein